MKCSVCGKEITTGFYNKYTREYTCSEECESKSWKDVYVKDHPYWNQGF